MRDITVIVHDSYVDKVVEALHTAGDMQISGIDRDEDIRGMLGPGSVHGSLSECTEYEMKLGSLGDVFDSIRDQEGGLKELLFPPVIEPVARKRSDFAKLSEELDTFLQGPGEDILGISRELNELREKREELESLRDAIKQIDLDMDLSYIGESPYTVYRLGKTRNPVKVKKVMSRLDTSHLLLNPGKDGDYTVVAGAFIRDRKKLDMLLRESDVKLLDLKCIKGTPSRALKELNERIGEYQGREREMSETLDALKKEHKTHLSVLEEELAIYRQKLEAYQGFGRTESTSVIKGWVPEDRVRAVEGVVDRYSGGCGVVVSREPKEGEEVPVSLNNPGLLKPFELLTRMFAPPKYDEVDPTVVIAPAFVIFFGLMLGDAVYGLLIIAVSLVLYHGIGRLEKGTRDFSVILLSAGISTFVFGILQGGYLGPNREEYLNILGRFGIEPPLLLDTLDGDGPLTLLIISLLIGLAYINLGLILSLVQHIRRKNYRSVVLENLSWWLLQPGGFILLSGMLFGWYDFSTPVYGAASVMVLVGMVLLVARAKGLSFFEITGFLGDFLSFARILALGLATAGIALTVNVLAYLVADSSMNTLMAGALAVAGAALLVRWLLTKDKKMMGAGISVLVLVGLGFLNPVYPFYVLSLVVLVGGHIVNASLQALGSFVHALRLQYVEFFGYFYEGGGTEFKPFQEQRDHTFTKEGVR